MAAWGVVKLGPWISKPVEPTSYADVDQPTNHWQPSGLLDIGDKMLGVPIWTGTEWVGRPIFTWDGQNWIPGGG